MAGYYQSNPHVSLRAATAIHALQTEVDSPHMKHECSTTLETSLHEWIQDCSLPTARATCMACCTGLQANSVATTAQTLQLIVDSELLDHPAAVSAAVGLLVVLAAAHGQSSDVIHTLCKIGHHAVWYSPASVQASFKALEQLIGRGCKSDLQVKVVLSIVCGVREHQTSEPVFSAASILVDALLAHPNMPMPMLMQLADWRGKPLRLLQLLLLSIYDGFARFATADRCNTVAQLLEIECLSDSKSILDSSKLALVLNVALQFLHVASSRVSISSCSRCVCYSNQSSHLNHLTILHWLNHSE